MADDAVQPIAKGTTKHSLHPAMPSARPVAAAGDKVKELAWRVMEGGEAPSAEAPPSVAVVHVGTHDLQGSDEVPGNQTEINAVSTDIINECVRD